MKLWMSMKAALTVMDLVTRDWARQLEVDECGVMVLMQLGCRQSSSAAKLALFCGRARQQVQRSLGTLQSAGLVRPDTVSSQGCTTSWILTEKGQKRWHSLARAARAWEETMDSAIDLQELARTLGRVVEVAVNRPGADGWSRGLIIPHELRKVPLWYEVSLEDESLDSAAEVAPRPHDEEASRQEREQERAEREWAAMWIRISS